MPEPACWRAVPARPRSVPRSSAPGISEPGADRTNEAETGGSFVSACICTSQLRSPVLRAQADEAQSKTDASGAVGPAGLGRRWLLVAGSPRIAGGDDQRGDGSGQPDPGRQWPDQAPVAGRHPPETAAIAEAEASVQAQQATLAQARRDLARFEALGQFATRREVEQRRLSVEEGARELSRRRAAVVQAREQRDRRVLRAPFAGVIL